VVDARIALIQHGLRSVQLRRERVAQLVEEHQHVAARHHAMRRHRDAIGLLDGLVEFIEGFKDAVHAADVTGPDATWPLLQASVSWKGPREGRHFSRSRSASCTGSGTRPSTEPP